MTRKNEESIVEDEKKEHPSESESLNRKNPKLEKNKTIDILNNIKSFSSLKKFTICSVFLSIILLFLPWAAEVSPINIVEMKNELFDIINFRNIPFTLNLFFKLGIITTLLLVLTIFTIYKSYYKFAGALQFLNIIVLALIILSNYSYYKNGELSNWLQESTILKEYSHEELKEIYYDVSDVFYDYGFIEKEHWMFKIMFSPSEQEKLLEDVNNKEYLSRKEKRKALSDWDLSIINLTPIFFVILFFTNCILIVILSRRKRLEISR